MTPCPFHGLYAQETQAPGGSAGPHQSLIRLKLRAALHGVLVAWVRLVQLATRGGEGGWLTICDLPGAQSTRPPTQTLKGGQPD